MNQLAATSWVEWLGMSTGIIGVWLSIKEKVAAWFFFIICYSCYVYIGFAFSLHALMGMNIAFIGISAYGWAKWARQGKNESSKLPISRTNPKHWPLIALFLGLGTFLVGTLLGRLDQAQLPHLDAFAACCALTAQWMLSRKHIETWLFWIVSDIVYLGIFFNRPSWPSVILFATFIGLAIKGWRDWQANLRQAT